MAPAGVDGPSPTRRAPSARRTPRHWVGCDPQEGAMRDSARRVLERPASPAPCGSETLNAPVAVAAANTIADTRPRLPRPRIRRIRSMNWPREAIASPRASPFRYSASALAACALAVACPRVSTAPYPLASDGDRRGQPVRAFRAPRATRAQALAQVARLPTMSLRGDSAGVSSSPSRGYGAARCRPYAKRTPRPIVRRHRASCAAAAADAQRLVSARYGTSGVRIRPARLERSQMQSGLLVSP